MRNFLILGVALSFLVACSTQSKVSTSDNSGYKSSGLIVMSKPAPALQTATPLTLLGFLPDPATLNTRWLSVNRGEGSVALMEGAKTVSVTKVEGLESLNPGAYEVMHKQRKALWYAPEEYFTSRNIDAPQSGDASRYLRGALGEFVLYLDPETPLHSGAIWSSDVGGLKFQEESLAKIYYSLEVGSLVEVQ